MAEWFAPRRYGWGSGPPITWQGWAVTLIYLGIFLGASQLLDRSIWAVASIVLPASAIFMTILAKTTRGGLRWHWKGKE